MMAPSSGYFIATFDRMSLTGVFMAYDKVTSAVRFLVKGAEFPCRFRRKHLQQNVFRRCRDWVASRRGPC
jgi:hypothetical protein